MGAGRSKIPKISVHYQNVKPSIIAPTTIRSRSLSNGANQRLHLNTAISTTNNNGMMPIAHPFPVPVPQPVPVRVPKPFPVPVVVPQVTHIRVPVPVPVDVPVPVAVPVKMPVKNNNNLQKQYMQNFQQMQNLQNMQNIQNIQNLQNLQNMAIPNYFAEQQQQHQHQHQQHQHHQHQHQHQYQHQHQHQVNDSYIDTQNTQKLFENVATAELLATEPIESNATQNFESAELQQQIQDDYQQLQQQQQHIVGTPAPITKIFDASYMAPLTNDYQSFENMNTSFVSSLKTNQNNNNNNNNNNNYIDDNIDDNELKVLEASKSVTSMRTIVKNYSNSPITILNPRASNHSLKDATLLSKKQNKKSNKNNNNNYDDSDPSLITYNSSKHTSKKRTSAAADSHITPPFTPTSQLTGMMSANQLHHYHNNRQSQQTNNTATTMTNNLNSTSIQHSIQLQQSSIHQTNTPIAGGGEASSSLSYNRSTPSYQTTASTFDPTLITPYGGYNNTYTSQKTHSSIPFSTENSMMVQPNYFTNTNVNGSGGGSAAAAGTTGAALNQNNSNSFMQFNNKDPNNPKDFSYMLFNIKVFRTPKEQS